MVVSQLAILLWPDFQKTLAMLNLKTSCSKASGNRSRWERKSSIKLRTGARDISVDMAEITTKSPSFLCRLTGWSQGETDNEALGKQAAQPVCRIEGWIAGKCRLDGRLQGSSAGQGGSEREVAGVQSAKDDIFAQLANLQPATACSQV